MHYLPAFLNLLPGAGHLYLRNYLSGILDLGCFAVVVLCAPNLTGLPAAGVVSFVMLSSAYRMYYLQHVRLTLAGVVDTRAEVGGVLRRIEPGWWIPGLNWPWLPLAAVASGVATLSAETESSWAQVTQGLPAAVAMARELLAPNWLLLPDAIKYARQTVDIALLGTLYGMAISIPLSVFSARSLMHANRVLAGVYYCARWIMAVVRATPTFLLGLIFVAWVGLGPFPGVLAIAVFSAALMTKLLSEAIEAVDPGPIEATAATGANLYQVIVFAVFPQVTTTFVAIALYCLEINIHSATVLGLIGAQGIGLPIHEYLSSLSYRNASVYIAVVITLTVAIDCFSAFVRSRIK